MSGDAIAERSIGRACDELLNPHGISSVRRAVDLATDWHQGYNPT
jgi:hypothetical protein